MNNINKGLETINKIDEQGRCFGVEFYLQGNEGQNDSHGLSYRGLRHMYRADLGEVMGFDKSNSVYQLETMGYIAGMRRKDLK